MSSASSARGQASVEWVAVVGVVAVVLVAAGAAAVPGASAVGRSIGGVFARAFCLVSGGDCLGGAPRPCVVRSESRSREQRGKAWLVRLSNGRTVLREERSDGTVALSVEEFAAGGAEASAAAGLLSGSFATGLRGVRGERFVAADAAAADRLMARLERGEEAGPPDETWRAAGHWGSAGARLGRFGPSVNLDSTWVAGVRERPATGERTVVLRNDAELVAPLTAPLALALGAAPAQASVELAFDGRGRAVALTVRRVAGVHGEVSLGPLRSGGGDLVEAEARLDLADPVAEALVAELLDTRSPRRVVAVAGALGDRLAERARVDVRVFETDRVSEDAGVMMRFGGYEAEEVTRTGRLVFAAGREPGEGWARRLDCVGVA